MVQILVLNKSNVVPGSNNSRYSYKFMGGGISLGKGDRIALQSIQIPYSVFNITSAYGNNSFGYKFNNVSYTINLLDGFYDMNDLNIQLQNTFYNNGHYRVQANGDFWYPAQFQYNPNLYAIQLNVFIITSSLPTNWTNPANFNVVSNTSVQIFIPDTNIKSIFGFNTGYYPTNPSNIIYSKISDFTPVGSPLNSIVMRCNLVDNKLCIPSDILFSLSPSVSFGSNQVVQASEYAWANCRRGNFTSLDIQLTDENFNQIQMKDNNLCILLLIKLASEEE